MASDRDVLDVAGFDFINLDVIAQAYGDRWVGVEEKIRAVARDFVESRLGPDALLIPAAEGFLVVFANAGAAESGAKSLSDQLNAHFTGTPDRPLPRVEAKLRTLPVADLLAEGQAKGNEHSANAPPTAKGADARVEWKFQPVWDARVEAVTTFDMVSSLDAVEGRPLDCSVKERAASDVAALNASERILEQMVGRGKKALVGVTIHVRSLVDPEPRARVFQSMAGFSRDLRAYRVITLKGVGPGFPILYLNEVLALLNARVPNILLALDLDASLAGKREPVLGFGWERPTIGLVEQLQRADPSVLRSLRALVRGAHARGRTFFVKGDFTPKTVLLLKAEGVDVISSPLVWPRVEAVDNVSRWPSAWLNATSDPLR